MRFDAKSLAALLALGCSRPGLDIAEPRSDPAPAPPSTPPSAAPKTQPVPASSAGAGPSPVVSSVAPAPSIASPPTSPSHPVDPGLKRPSFRDAWPAIRSLLSDGDLRRIDQALVDPTLGVYVLDNPGVLVVPTRFERLSDAFNQPGVEPDLSNAYKSRDFPQIKDCRLRDGPLPTFSCSTEKWSSEGCVHARGASPRIRRLAEEYVRAGEGREFTAADRAQFGAAGLVDRVCTDAVWDGDTYYFGRVAGRWRLLAIDIVTPCSA
jgi:hypothetical protein